LKDLLLIKQSRSSAGNKTIELSSDWLLTGSFNSLRAWRYNGI
jgi:hypothetical protein